MKTQSSDTSPEAERIIVEHMRQMTPNDKFDYVLAMNAAIAQMCLPTIRQSHPNADAREIQLRLASRRLPEDLLKRATGWDVKEKGY